MRYPAIIEMPRGEDRRIRMAFDGSGFVDLGPRKERIAINDGIMPFNYGYIEHATNKTEGDNLDVIILSKKRYKTGDKAYVEIIAMLTRENGDHKLIAADDSLGYTSFSDVPIKERNMIVGYFGYKSKITSVEDKEHAEEYLKTCFTEQKLESQKL